MKPISCTVVALQLTDARELEGVHFAWINPVVKYERYKEMAA